MVPSCEPSKLNIEVARLKPTVIASPELSNDFAPSALTGKVTGWQSLFSSNVQICGDGAGSQMQLAGFVKIDGNQPSLVMSAQSAFNVAGVAEMPNGGCGGVGVDRGTFRITWNK